MTKARKFWYYLRFSEFVYYFASVMSVSVIDVFEFCRHYAHQEGELKVADSERVLAECVDEAGVLSWCLDGGRSGLGFPQLRVTVKGVVNLLCQRCLTPFFYTIDSETVLMLARSEEQADEIESMLEDEAIDVIVGQKALDVMALVEDEILLSLPGAPKHVTCPDVVAAENVKGEVVDSPFAFLKNLQ